MPHKQANALFIQYAINDFNWENTFSNIDIDKRVESFNEIIPNIFSNPYVLVMAHMRFRVNPHSIVV